MHVISNPHVSIFNFLFFVVAMKRCPITAKIAGLIQILQCCVLNDFFTEGYERLRDLCGLSQSPILCVWEIWSCSNIRVYMYHVFHWLAKKRKITKKKVCHTAPILKLTYDQKLDTFFIGLR